MEQTAEEFLIQKGIANPLGELWRLDLSRDCYAQSEKDIQKAMIEFAKLHVEAALKAKGKAMTEKSYEDSSYSMGELDAFTRDCYPLENIK